MVEEALEGWCVNTLCYFFNGLFHDLELMWEWFETSISLLKSHSGDIYTPTLLSYFHYPFPWR